MPERGGSVAVGLHAPTGSSVRCGDLPLASSADETNDGPCQGAARTRPDAAACQGRILTGAERRLNLTLPSAHIPIYRHRH